MDDHSSISAFAAVPDDRETHTDDIEVGTLRESGLTQSYSAGSGVGRARNLPIEANIILIAHPEGKRLGSRIRLSRGASIEIGRDPEAEVCISEVLSVSRRHARLEYRGDHVALTDLGSTNGTYLNGQLIKETARLRSGDRFQVAAVHFKFLHELDVEHAYYRAISELVTRDGLTEVYNQRKLEEELEREVARAVRYGRPLAMIFFDLDDFKRVNDSYGHLCGDFVLKQVTNEVRTLLRPEQVLARVGGDEFVILCPETSRDGAMQLAEKLRSKVAGLDYSYSGMEIRVTCSFGVAELQRKTKDPAKLYEAADRALYASKRAGRNSVSFDGEES
jgi:diguanylate cyclase (GGDEF)-like protein